MSEPQPHPEPDRRHRRVSHEQLRRYLLAADEERYRLQNELRLLAPVRKRAWAVWPQTRRRIAVGVGTVIVTGLAGGLAWQMCPSSARADERSSVRVKTIAVTPRLVVNEPSEAQPPPVKIVQVVKVVDGVKAGKASTAPRPRMSPRVRSRTVLQTRRGRSVPRPLSPGEFGRPRLAAY